MTDPTRPEPPSSNDEPEQPLPDDRMAVVAVTVIRTGGFAGLRRTWHAQPDTAETPHWIALIEECPWDAADPSRQVTPQGADRFGWHVDARCGDAEREAALTDPEVQGPWRALIDAVRAVTPGSQPPKAAR